MSDLIENPEDQFTPDVSLSVFLSVIVVQFVICNPG